MHVAVTSAMLRGILRLCPWFTENAVLLTLSAGHCSGIGNFSLLSILRLKLYHHELGGLFFYLCSFPLLIPILLRPVLPNLSNAATL